MTGTWAGAASDDRPLDPVLAIGADAGPAEALTRLVEAAVDAVSACHGSLEPHAPGGAGVPPAVRVDRAPTAPDPTAAAAPTAPDLTAAAAPTAPDLTAAAAPTADVARRRALLVPIRVGDAPFAVLRLADRMTGEFTADDERVARAFAVAAGVVARTAELAVEVAQRRRDTESLALFADRDRIARNLHDLVIQRLFATGMALQAAARRVAVDPVDAARRVDRAVADLDATIREIRTAVFALQRPADGASSLRAEVVAIVDAAAATLGFGPSVQFDGLVDTIVPDDAAEHLLAVLREALSNVARHARATAVGVAVSVQDDVVLRVSDDGVGVAPGGRRSGLANLQARAGLLGGALTIGDAKPGTVLEWRVPLRPA